MRRWTVDQGQAGERLDRLVARRFAVARNQVQQWIRDGYVTVDGTPRRTSYAVRHGEEIACEPQAKQTAANLTPEDEDLTLLHEDPHLVVVDKPAGLAVHPGAGRPAGTLVNRLLARYPELESVGGRDRPGIVHRLDIDTTGVLVVARTERAYQALSQAFAERRVTKTYLGTVFGTPAPAEGWIEHPIGRHPKRRKEMTVRPDGRSARTGYRVLETGTGAALLTLDLETGRTHQIRVHLKAIGHPLVGDALYAGNRWKGAPPTVRRLTGEFPRPALHAWTLALTHPTTGERQRFVAPIPVDLAELWRRLAIPSPSVDGPTG